MVAFRALVRLGIAHPRASHDGVHPVAIARFFPLERDEGEYAYAGQLILQGVPPYQECYNMKWPGTYVAYAAIMAVFGESTEAIHLGLLLMSLMSALLVFLIGRRIGGLGMGAVAASTEALLAVSPSANGFAGTRHPFCRAFCTRRNLGAYGAMGEARLGSVPAGWGIVWVRLHHETIGGGVRLVCGSVAGVARDDRTRARRA